MTTNSELIYLDNAATTYPKPTCVYEAAETFYRTYGGNAGRGSNPLARKCAALIEETRTQLSDWLNAPSSEHVIFTASATIALNQAILGAGNSLVSGGTAYVTPFEHNSVLRPIEHLRDRNGFTMQEIPFDRQTYACQLERLGAIFRSDPPALVCITQASNVCGLMPPVESIAELTKQVNPQAIVIVDGAQTAGLYPLDLNSGLIDAFIFSGHKALYGPYGIAGLVLASDWRPQPLLFGGTGTASEQLTMPNTLPSAYEAGSQNVWAIAGLHGALNWLETTGRTAVLTHVLELATSLREELEQYFGVHVYAPPKERNWSGIIAFTTDGIRPQVVEAALGAKGIAVRAGLHCAPWTHRWLGQASNGGLVRLSPGYFNNSEDILELLHVMTTLLR
jgi:cysteine desulfurase family protein